jgi:thymidylate kinase
VDPEICRENVLKKAKRNYTNGQVMDEAESNFNHQMETAKEYKKMVEKNPKNWVLINCCENGKLMPPEKIHEIIWEKVKKIINV